MKLSKQVTTVLILLFSIGIIVGVRFLNTKGGINKERGRFLGDPSAPIRVIEYTDFQCPACRLAAKELKKIMKEYPHAIYLEHKYYPLRSHRNSLAAAIFAQCAAQQGKFWEYYDLLFELQPLWVDRINPRDVFLDIAKDIKLDKEELTECVTERKIEEKVKEEKQEGSALGVRATPTFFVNGDMVVGAKKIMDVLTKKMKEVQGEEKE